MDIWPYFDTEYYYISINRLPSDNEKFQIHKIQNHFQNKNAYQNQYSYAT